MEQTFIYSDRILFALIFFFRPGDGDVDRYHNGLNRRENGSVFSNFCPDFIWRIIKQKTKK